MKLHTSDIITMLFLVALGLALSLRLIEKGWFLLLEKELNYLTKH